MLRRYATRIKSIASIRMLIPLFCKIQSPPPLSSSLLPSTWYPALGDLFLQSSDLGQALRLSYDFLNTLLLFLCELYAITLVATGNSAVRSSGGSGDVEGAGFDAHCLGRVELVVKVGQWGSKGVGRVGKGWVTEAKG